MTIWLTHFFVIQIFTSWKTIFPRNLMIKSLSLTTILFCVYWIHSFIHFYYVLLPIKYFLENAALSVLFLFGLVPTFSTLRSTSAETSSL